MVFHLITIFPESLKSYFKTSVLARAQKDKLIKINIINIRDFTKNKHKITDDRPYGGGAGMVMKAEPIIRAVDSLLDKSKSDKKKILVLSAKGKQFSQKDAYYWSKKYKDIILICGRYEGIDERVKKVLKAQEISVGPYVLTGGELAAGIITDAISRHVPGVLGKKESLEENRGIGIPVYTRPEVFEWPLSGRGKKKYRVPKVLLSGHHKKIEEWRKKHRKI